MAVPRLVCKSSEVWAQVHGHQHTVAQGSAVILQVTWSLQMLKRFPSNLKSRVVPILFSSSPWRRFVMHRRRMLKNTGANIPLSYSSAYLKGQWFLPSIDWSHSPQHGTVYFPGQPHFIRIPQNSFQFTAVKALERSIDAMERFWFCSWCFSCNCHTVILTSTVLRFCLKPHIDPGSRCSARCSSFSFSCFDCWMEISVSMVVEWAIFGPTFCRLFPYWGEQCSPYVGLLNPYFVAAKSSCHSTPAARNHVPWCTGIHANSELPGLSSLLPLPDITISPDFNWMESQIFYPMVRGGDLHKEIFYSGPGGA